MPLPPIRVIAPPPSGDENWLEIAGRRLPVDYCRHPRARRYVLRLAANGRVRVTVPRLGSLRGAREFLDRHAAWLARQLLRQAARPAPHPAWHAGTHVWFRGQSTPLLPADDPGPPRIRLADQFIPVPADATDWRPAVERHLRTLAAQELPPRVTELAALDGLTIHGVSIRNQRSRWGSCSRRGMISLNWRLVQMPPAVRDYILWHELMHRREMNHSERFWTHVRRVCPDFPTHRHWLRHHGRALH